ncbi:MAG: hypothetical protein L6Q63_16675 [Giesbergeria sp.]|nr:hypothetical protein [Giesbergeria sp.]
MKLLDTRLWVRVRIMSNYRCIVARGQVTLDHDGWTDPSVGAQHTIHGLCGCAFGEAAFQ